MNKRDALKLKPGTVITFGDSMWIAKSAYVARGVVRSVIPGGQILVRVLPNKHKTKGEQPTHEQRVPYHHVVRVTHERLEDPSLVAEEPLVA